MTSAVGCSGGTLLQNLCEGRDRQCHLVTLRLPDRQPQIHSIRIQSLMCLRLTLS